MKRFTSSMLLVLGLGGPAFAGAPVYTVFNNVGTITQRSNIVDNIVINDGTIDFLLGLTNTFSQNSDPFTSIVYQTQQTLFFTNTGTWIGQPGFDFQYNSTSGSRPASSFYSSGAIVDYDIPVEGFQYLGGTGAVLLPPAETLPAINAPVLSRTVVSATNIFIDNGTMQVGDGGMLQLNGQNVKLNNAILIAGTLGELDTNATLGQGLQEDLLSGGVNYPAFAPPYDTYDVYWGVTNGGSYLGNVLDLSDIPLDLGVSGLGGLVGEDELLELNPNIQGSRNGSVEGIPVYDDIPAEDFFPLSGNPLATALNGTLYPAGVFVPYIITTFSLNANNPLQTNFYVNVVLVNTNFANSDITAQVGFVEGEIVNSVGNGNIDSIPFEDIVKFSAPALDITSGQTVTNSIYLLDSGAVAVPLLNATNVTYQNDAKPDNYEITRIEPADWELWLEEQTLFVVSNVLDPNLLYAAGEFKSTQVPTTNAIYAVQIGRNPEAPNGLAPFTATLLGSSYDMPDLTNETGRIEINAQTVDLSNLILRGSGVVKIIAPNVTGAAPAATDFGNITCDLGNVNSLLTISNIVPVAYHRLMGDVLAWNADWVNNQTNSIPGGDKTTSVTNTWIYHLLVVDQDLRSTFRPSAINLALRGSNVVVDDQLNIIGSALFQATNLTFNASLHMSGNTPSLFSANMPVTQNLLIGPTGSISADNAINLGVATSSSPVNPATTSYSFNSITNLGAVGGIASGAVQLQSRIFANGGSVLCTNNGGLQIISMTNLLGAGPGLGLGNSLAADRGISLTSLSIQVSNSTILCGQTFSGPLTLSATSQLTDFLPNEASTNAYSTNTWTVGAGFSLPTKPVTGDLFGTKIITVAGGTNRTVTHVWAGVDWSNNIAMGYSNNAVIGHLVLDRPTNSLNTTLRFSAAGAKNAMYVDYLELADLAFSDYHTGLVIDPNLTIYFADSNEDPTKLHQVYPNLVWVPEFAGPNSSVLVAYQGGSNVLMNLALRESSSIDSDFDGIPNLTDPFPLDNPVLGPIPNPNNSSNVVLSVVNGGSLVVWTVGNGTITPVGYATNSYTAGQILSLTAVPAAGATFFNWTMGTKQGPVVLSTQPVLNYVVPATNAFLMANFVPTPFPSLAGAYNGLFYQTNGVAADSSGQITFNVGNTGFFSGRLRLGITNYPFTGQFPGDGQVTVQSSFGTNVLSISLLFDTVNLSNLVTGTVSGANWQAILMADRAPVWTALNPAPQAGRYTFVLPGHADPSASPGGDSYGTITVDPIGHLAAILTLADNVVVSQAVPLSKDGQWPLYFAVAGVPQTLLGWVTFNTNNTGLSGLVNWIKAPGKGLYYTNGFITSSVLVGDRYVMPTNQASVLTLINPTVMLSGANLAAPVDEPVSLIGKLVYESADRHVILSINPGTGRVSGLYAPGGGNRSAVLGGVALQIEQTARGFFLGTNQSGAWLLQGE